MLALLVNQHHGHYYTQLQNIDEQQLPAADVTVSVEWSSLNYKDALAITGKGKVVRQFPMVPGIDLAGTVRHSADRRFTPGQAVLATGFGLGSEHWGGLAQLARVKGDWLELLPDGLTTRQAMIIGTAGFTAMLCVMALEQAGIQPQQGEIVVSGACGGVGSTAITLLHQLDYRVVAVSSKADQHDYLRQLGASEVLPRQQFTNARALESQRWAGAVDCVGGDVLAKILAQTHEGGCVAACGMAAATDLHTSVMPFILRNVRLQGINAVCPSSEQRITAWQRLTRLLPAHYYQLLTHEIPLSQAPDKATQLLENRLHGRLLVRIPAYSD